VRQPARGVEREPAAALLAAQGVDVLRREAGAAPQLAAGDATRLHRLGEPLLPVAHAVKANASRGFRQLPIRACLEAVDNFSFRTQLRGMESSPSPALPIHLEVAARTDRGLERDGNEDSLLVSASGATGRALARGDRADLVGPTWVTLAVCDGMGGAAGGEVASRCAADVIGEVLAARPLPSRDALGRQLVTAVEEASRRVFAAARADRALHGMGTTATVCALRGDVLFVAQVGDSRAYVLRGDRLTQLTRDQTLATFMVERGQLLPEEVPDFPLGHVILQAVGTSDRVEVDLIEARLARGDVLLVCSDGLTGPVPDEVIRRTLREAPTPEAAVEALVARANEAGGPDNVTCIVARIGGEGLPPASGADEVPHAKACFAPEPVEEVPAPAVEGVAPERARSGGMLGRLAALFGW